MVDSLAGLGLLGQRHQNPDTLLLQFSEHNQSDKTQLTSMATYLVDSVVFGQAPETDARALQLYLEFFVLFSAIGGPTDVNATHSIPEAVNALIEALLSSQRTDTSGPECGFWGWAKPNAFGTDLELTVEATNALKSALDAGFATDPEFIEQRVTAAIEAIREQQKNDGGWSRDPCGTDGSNSFATTLATYAITRRNPPNIIDSQQRAMNLLAQLLTDRVNRDDHPLTPRETWAVTRLMALLPTSLTVPPIFVWNPISDPSVDGYPETAPSFDYDVQKLIIESQLADGTFRARSTVKRIANVPSMNQCLAYLPFNPTSGIFVWTRGKIAMACA